MSTVNPAPSVSDSILDEIAVDISLKVSWAILALFHSRGLGTYEAEMFHKSTFKKLGTKVFEVAKMNFDERVQ
jgi:hypothetical protein